jgi:hypothetical protein
VSTVLWNMQGWSEIGCLAGEIEGAEKVFPPGMALAAVLIVLAYASPVLFGIAIEPPGDVGAEWVDGYFVTLASSVAPWLGAAVLVSAALANMSTFLTSLAAYSRTLQAVAREGILPIPLLARNMTRYRTPVPAIAVLAVTTTVLLAVLDFNILVVVDSAFFMVANVSIILAFLRLKYTQPDLPRPYTFPGGRHGAWAAVVVTLSLAFFALYTVGAGAPWAAAVVGGVVAGLLLTAAVVHHLRPITPLVVADEEGEEGGGSGEGGAGGEGRGRLGSGEDAGSAGSGGSRAAASGMAPAELVARIKSLLGRAMKGLPRQRSGSSEEDGTRMGLLASAAGSEGSSGGLPDARAAGVPPAAILVVPAVVTAGLRAATTPPNFASGTTTPAPPASSTPASRAAARA